MAAATGAREAGLKWGFHEQIDDEADIEAQLTELTADH
jgi:hypothetical protein